MRHTVKQTVSSEELIKACKSLHWAESRPFPLLTAENRSADVTATPLHTFKAPLAHHHLFTALVLSKGDHRRIINSCYICEETDTLLKKYQFTAILSRDPAYELWKS